jgi:hypothetical protein
VAIGGLLYKFGVTHPWHERAAAYCFAALERDPPSDAHAIRDALVFLEHTPERERAEFVIATVVRDLRSADYFLADASDERYGLRPFAFAPTPASRWRTLFRDGETAAHLDALAAEQEEDGGWPVRWQPPNDAARCEWRGIETVQALRVLVAMSGFTRGEPQ